MNILITGATGFIGSNLAAFLSKKKHNLFLISKTNRYKSHKKKIISIKSDINFNHKVLKKLIKFSFIIGGLIIFMSGSRGGLLGLFLILISYLFLNFKFNSFKSYSYFSLLLLFGFFLVIPVLSILTLESLNTVNSSQYVRFYQGFNLSIYVLSNYLFGIPLGALENAYQISSGESSAIFSFFIFNVIYHGWLSFLFLIFLFIKLIFSKIHINTRIYFLIYLLLYFNMTGIIISPDTYFWFFCFYYTYRISKGKIHKQIDESIYI